MLGLARFTKFTEESGVIQAFDSTRGLKGLAFLTTRKGMNKFENGSGISLVLEECDSII